MRKLKHHDKKVILLTVESVENFFRRGKKTAQDIDRKRELIARRVISFEDPVDFMKFLTRNKLRLVATIRKHPDSVTRLANFLHRSRAAVTKDIQELESVGIVKTEYVVNPGHGKQKIIKISDENPIRLQLKAII